MRYHKELRKVLHRARVPITRRKVACIVEDADSNCFSGWNTENTSFIKHAEVSALYRAPRQFRVKVAHLMSNGTVLTLKNAIPCENCTNILLHKASPSMKVILWPEKDNGKNYTASLRQIKNAYAAMKAVPLMDPGRQLAFLKMSTPLTSGDRKFVLSMCVLLRDYNAKYLSSRGELYITGSASGRGGPKTIFTRQITGKDYADIDFIFIFPQQYPVHVEGLISAFYREALINNNTEPGKLQRKMRPSYKLDEMERESKDFLFRKEYSSKGSPHIIPIDVSVGRKLKAVATKLYIRKNWLVRLV